MIKDIKIHPFHYLVLLVILNLGIGMFFMLRFNLLYQTIVVLTTGIAYVIWGVVHHWLEEDLHLKVFLEYFLIALIFCVVILSLLLRA